MPTAGLGRTILAIAIPAMLTNIATALFGLADIWVIGQLGDAAAQGAVELGARLMMALLVVFNFLRTGTIALTAQASGREDLDSQAAVLVRALALAAGLGALLLVLWPVAVPLGLGLLGATGEVAANARTYVDIRYAGGLLWLLNAVLVGYLIGRRRVRAVLAVEVGANIVHIGLDLLLVLGLRFGIAGVATATLASEALKSLALMLLVSGEGPSRLALDMVRRRGTWDRTALGDLVRMNRDLFLRTLLLTGAMVLMTRGGAEQGATVLAANGVLLQLFALSALILDGFESAAQVLCGEAAGRRDRAGLVRLVRVLVGSGLALGVAIALGYLTAGPALVATFSTDQAVVATVRAHLGWAALLPILGAASFVFDGVFIGAGWTRAMLVTMAAAFAAYVAALGAAGGLGNDGLWLAFALFLAARAAGQAAMLPGLTRAMPDRREA